MNRKDRALRRLRYIFPDADNIRISDPRQTIFAIVGDETIGRCVKKEKGSDTYEEVDFEYVDERIVASGDTVVELVESALKYKRVESMSHKEYLEEELGTEIDDDLYQ